MITLTQDAAEVVRGTLADGDLPQGSALRLGLTNEGCEGTQFRYVLALDPDPAKPDDQLFESHGVRIVVSRESLPHLDGLQLGVRPKLGGVDFVFQNPQATHSCGCGHTFSD
jgi:iron-sulfur cluster assembly protein